MTINDLRNSQAEIYVIYDDGKERLIGRYLSHYPNEEVNFGTSNFCWFWVDVLNKEQLHSPHFGTVRRWWIKNYDDPRYTIITKQEAVLYLALHTLANGS